LKQNVALARDFKALSKAEQTTLVEKVKPFATDGRFEQFKSRQNFDGPVHRRQHGFQTLTKLAAGSSSLEEHIDAAALLSGRCAP
jgi:hypothetical protein